MVDGMEIIGWVGFSQGLFAALLMLSKSEQALSDKILSGWLVLLAIDFLTCAIDYRIFGFSLLSSSFLLFNPALYIYIRSLVEKNFRLKWVLLLHLVPFVISEVLSYTTRIQFTFENFFELNSTFIYRFSIALVTVVSWAVYIPLSIRKLYKYRQNLQNEQSNIDKGQNLNWLQFVSVFYILYCFVAIVLGAVFVLIDTGEGVLMYYNYIVLLVLIYIISLYGLLQRRIELQTEPQIESEGLGYKKSTLTPEIKQDIEQKVLEYFENEQAFLNPNLNMELLSEVIQYPKYQITEVLNVELGKSFFQFVNSYRIEAVKKKLLEPKLKFSIEAIGYECGFNSKSSFYTVFKNITGETPVAFRKRMLGRDS